MTAADPVVGVLALQGDVREHLRALTECGVPARPVRRADEVDLVDALVIPGGESTTMSKLAEEFGVLEPIRKRIAGGMPAYGSCAGMIMLATTVLDGRPDQRGFGGIGMTVRRNAFGRQVDSFEAPVAIEGISGPPVNAVFIRAPWVESVDDGVRVLGRVTDGPPPSTGAWAAPDHAGVAGRAAWVAPDHAGVAGRAAWVAPDHAGVAGRIVAVAQGSLLATSFHPELTGDLRVHRLFVEMARAGMTTTEG